MTLTRSELPPDRSELLVEDASVRPALLGRPDAPWLARPQNVFLLIALIMGWGMAFLTPPLQVPDEPAHLFRVWQLSQGHVLAKHYHVTIPQEVWDLMKAASPVTGNPHPSIPFSQILKGWTGPPPGKQTLYPRIDNTALYSPVPYLPQILGVLLARKLKWSALALLYAGRVGTVIGYAFVGWWAIRVTPVLKWPAAVTLAAPMTIFMAASVSADPMTTAFAYLSTAFCLRMILAREPVARGVVVGLGLSLVALTLCKSAYFPIVFLLAVVPKRNWGAARWWIPPSVILLLVLIALFGWSALSKPLGVREAGGDPAVQFHYVLYHPGSFLGNVVRSLNREDFNLYQSAVGVMGWLDVIMPISFIDIYTAAVLWLVFTYDEPVFVPIAARAFAIVALVASVFLIVLANYLVWTATRGRFTEGLQGRYFLPLVMLFFVIIQRPGRYRVSAKWLALAVVWCNVLAYWCVFSRYYLAA